MCIWDVYLPKVYYTGVWYTDSLTDTPSRYCSAHKEPELAYRKLWKGEGKSKFLLLLAWSTYSRPKFCLLHTFGALPCGQYPCAGLEGMWFYEQGKGIGWVTPSCISVLKLCCCGARNAKGDRDRGRMETAAQTGCLHSAVHKHLCILQTQIQKWSRLLTVKYVIFMHHLVMKVFDFSWYSEMSSPELLKFLLVRNVINSPRKLSHTVNVSKKFQAVTPDLAHQVQSELAVNLIYSKPG